MSQTKGDVMSQTKGDVMSRAIRIINEIEDRDPMRFIDNEKGFRKAEKIIKDKGLIPACEPYEATNDLILRNLHVGRWDFKKPNTRDVVLELVYAPTSVSKIKARIDLILNK